MRLAVTEVHVWGKIIGGFAGFAVGGPLGAVLGAAAGHAVDHLSSQPAFGGRTGPPFRVEDRAAREAAFGVAIIVLGAKMAKVDGVVSRAEINAFKEVFRVPGEELKNVARIFDAAKQDAGGFEPYARQAARLFRDDPAVLEELLAGLFHIARADGPVKPAEMAYLRRVAAIFGFGPRTFDRIQAPFHKPEAIDPYAVLGVSRRASDAEIKSAYRKLIREHHPDALVAKGMPADFVAVANEKMAAINAAYERVEKERGLK